MKCIILAAGYATRLYPLTKNFPKPLLPLGDKRILDWLIDDLAGNTGINEFIVISNHRYAVIFDEWADTKMKAAAQNGFPYTVTVVDDGTDKNEMRLGAVRDIQFAIEKLNIEDDLLVMAGDNILDFSLGGFMNFAVTKNTSCVMCHEEYDLKRQQKTAIITMDASNLITSYEEKPVEPKGHYAVPPFYFYKAEDASRIDEALSDGCDADAPGSFAAWLSDHASMHAYVMPGKRYDIGDVESYEKVKKLFEVREAH